MRGHQGPTDRGSEVCHPLSRQTCPPLGIPLRIYLNVSPNTSRAQQVDRILSPLSKGPASLKELNEKRMVKTRHFQWSCFWPHQDVLVRTSQEFQRGYCIFRALPIFLSILWMVLPKDFFAFKRANTCFLLYCIKVHIT